MRSERCIIGEPQNNKYCARTEHNSPAMRIVKLQNSIDVRRGIEVGRTDPVGVVLHDVLGLGIAPEQISFLDLGGGNDGGEFGGGRVDQYD